MIDEETKVSDSNAFLISNALPPDPPNKETQSEQSDYFFICPECSSLITIDSIDTSSPDNIKINFTCENSHKQKGKPLKELEAKSGNLELWRISTKRKNKDSYESLKKRQTRDDDSNPYCKSIGEDICPECKKKYHKHDKKSGNSEGIIPICNETDCFKAKVEENIRILDKEKKICLNWIKNLGEKLEKCFEYQKKLLLLQKSLACNKDDINIISKLNSNSIETIETNYKEIEEKIILMNTFIYTDKEKRDSKEERNNTKTADEKPIFDSKIITKENQKKFIEDIFFKIKFDKLYSASDYKNDKEETPQGKEVVKFHELCDGKENTLTIIKTNLGSVFGGYTEFKWSNDGNFKKDDNSFVFSLNEGSNTWKKYPSNKVDDGISSGKAFGPCFGEIISIGRRFLSDSSSSNYEASSYSGAKFFDENDSYFLVDELEVFQVKKND